MFDEMKYHIGFYFNGKGDIFIGKKDIENISLDDVFQGEIDSDVKYACQFLYKDGTSKFSFRPGYIEAGGEGLDVAAICNAIVACTTMLEQNRFEVALIVCDGATTNYNALQTLSQTYPYKNEHKFDHSKIDECFPHETKQIVLDKVHFCFENPIDSCRPIYFCLCSSHGLKNMRNALLGSSANEQSKKFFCLKGIFGEKVMLWDHIVELYEKSTKEHQGGKLKLCKNLNSSSVLPNILSSFMKMRVQLALNIMNRDVSLLLREQSHTKATATFIDRVCDIYDPLLGDEMISDYQIKNNMLTAIAWFSNWMKDAHNKHINKNADEIETMKEKMDIKDRLKHLPRTINPISLRNMVTSVKGYLCYQQSFYRDEVSVEKGYRIIPKRISSQNSLENYFSEMKALDNGGGVLDQNSFKQRSGKLNTLDGCKINVPKNANCYLNESITNMREQQLQSLSVQKETPLKRKTATKKEAKRIKIANVADVVRSSA